MVEGQCCDLCTAYTVSGAMRFLGNGQYVCEDCVDKINEAPEIVISPTSGNRTPPNAQSDEN